MRWLLILLALISPCTAQSIGGGFNPANPAASGYTLTFNDSMNSLSTFDLTGSGAPGFNWYLTRFFGATTVPSSSLSLATDGQGGVVVQGDFNGYQIGSAGPKGSSPGWVGTVFGGGWYVQADIKFNAPAVTACGAGCIWPAFWAMSVEHMAGFSAVPNAQWPGQPNNPNDGGAALFEHFIENDMFEYLCTVFGHGDAGCYAVSLHDWYGYYDGSNGTFPNVAPYCAGNNNFCGFDNNGYCNSKMHCNLGTQGTSVEAPPLGVATNWSNFHTISQLWVPANPITGSIGFTQNYFDGIPVSSNTWNAYPTTTPPPLQNGLWSIMDSQHLVLVWGTGNTLTMTIRNVKVWSPPAVTAVPIGKLF